MIKPTTPTISKSTLSLLEIAANAAAAVNDTHNPCRIHVFRYLINDGLRLSKRPSLPTLWTLLNRKIPSLNAQITISAASSRDLISKISVSTKVIAVVRT